MKHKALAFVLALCMVISMLPVSVFAAQPRDTGVMVPNAVGTLEPAAIEPNAKSYSVSLTGSSHGTVELMVDSPAQAGSEVYFLADPDDGYLAYIYCDGVDPEDVVYVGAEVYGFIMPANKVAFEVEFVAAEGEEHYVEVYAGGYAGEYAVSRSSAKAGESVLLAVYPYYYSEFDPMKLVLALGADVYYLFEEDGIFYYEIFMADENAIIFLTYSYRSTFKISFRPVSIFNGTVYTDVKDACTGEEVFVYAKPDAGYRLDNLVVTTEGRGIAFDVNYVRDEQGTKVYSFIMPPCNVMIDADFYADTKTVTVNAGPGGTAYADVTQANVGDTVTVTCQPEDNYRVYNITGVDGIVDNGDNTYSFAMPARDVTIDVTFKSIYNPVTVTVETGLGGTASVDPTEAKAGDTVTVVCTPEEGYHIAQISGVPDLTDNGDGVFTFTMPDTAVDIQVLFLRNENPFLDVNETHFFYHPVLWAVEEGITSGMTPETFGPFGVCNRAQVVTFLWRYAGSPEPAITENPFTDVPEESWYTNAVLWAVENGITMGVSPTEFGPELPCNRAQVVTFLWRAAGQPEPAVTENPFEDTHHSDFYYTAVLWALENGITTGATATTFNPGGECQRAQVVTFLWRAAGQPEPVN